ncbi:MAG: TonB-dependent receptor [Candidatus Manganitrophus sp. SB1]|nr:TonB-dependent receptor [Candidatus Manganitrophus morganii]
MTIRRGIVLHHVRRILAEALFLTVVLLLIENRPLAWGQEVSHATNSQDALTELSLEELMNVEIVTYSKSPIKWFNTPAAIFVITQEDIRRSGVTSVPEALRMAPGVQVARINANQWAIGIRGFTSRLSRSILVLIDGRSVYNPLFAGVYWEVQDLLLEDIERIEVIRGPGGVIWGANAVNGVINIITKHSKETQGGLVTLGAGTEERGFGGVRYGGRSGEELHYRVYAKYFDRDAGFHQDGVDFDDWRMGQAGFRTDLDITDRDAFTLQGDFYTGEAGQRTTFGIYTPPFSQTVLRDADLSGGNLLFRWGHVRSERSDWTLKVYYDYTNREEANFEEERHTLDFDFQHHLRLIKSQALNWGAGYRLNSDDTSGVETVEFIPADRTDAIYSAFVQYQIGFIDDRVVLTLGSKFEHNDYSGFELQPSGRALWKPTETQVVWSAVTRAVRTPTRLEHDLALSGILDPATNTFGRVLPNESFESETMIAYELGYRVQPQPRLSFTSTTFYNKYANLSTLEMGAPSFTEAAPPGPDRVIVPFFFTNQMDGHTYGVELMTDWQAKEWWRVNFIYSFLQIHLNAQAGFPTRESSEAGTEGSSPHHQAGLRSMIDLPGNLEFDWFLRYVDRLPAQVVKRYYNLDLRLGWHPTEKVELSVVGQNLLDQQHAEFARGVVEVQRGVYAKVTVQWE